MNIISLLVKNTLSSEDGPIEGHLQEIFGPDWPNPSSDSGHRREAEPASEKLDQPLLYSGDGPFGSTIDVYQRVALFRFPYPLYQLVGPDAFLRNLFHKASKYLGDGEFAVVNKDLRDSQTLENLGGFPKGEFGQIVESFTGGYGLPSPSWEALGNGVWFLFKPTQDSVFQGMKFECMRCHHTGCEVGEIRASGGSMAGIFELDNEKFSFRSCTRCKFTEFFRGEVSTLENIVDLFVG